MIPMLGSPCFLCIKTRTMRNTTSPFFLSLSLAQEKRIGSLDAANSRLMAALTQVKEHYSSSVHNGLSASNPTKLSITESGEFRNSSC